LISAEGSGEVMVVLLDPEASLAVFIRLKLSSTLQSIVDRARSHASHAIDACDEALDVK